MAEVFDWVVPVMLLQIGTYTTFDMASAAWRQF
jgi:hypothetical protein